MSDAEIQNTLGALVADSARRHVVVQFRRPLDPGQREAVEAAGATLLRSLGGNAYFASIDAGTDPGALTTLRALRSVQGIERAWKMHPRVLANEVPVWAIVRQLEEGDPIVALYVLFHPDVPLLTASMNLVQRHGAVVVDDLESINGLVIELPQGNIPALADEDAVQWVEWPLPRFDAVNDSNRAITEADIVQGTPYNLDGSGVTVLVYDGGTARETHNDFGGRLTVYDSSGMADHATHVAGTIGGDGSASSGTYKGMAPGVTMLSYGYEWDDTGIFLYNNPGDIESDYDEAINVRGADISNNSIGTNTALYWDCAITGEYGITSQLIDTIVRGDGSNPDFDEPFRVVWANGNERQTSRCGDTYFTTAPPAGAKNHITVGALNSNDDSMTGFSSWGPVNDGRLKPDISAPGCQSTGDGGVTSTFSTDDSAYGTYCGTSMAAPTVTGLSALLIEDFRNQFPAKPMFRNSTLKCWLAHTAVDRGNTGPDYKFGYGSVRIQQAIDFMRTGSFLEDSVDQGETFSRNVTVGAGQSELKVTLAWDDLPGTPNVEPALVNDLDLRVYSPSGVRHYPWTLDPNDPAAAAVRTKEDHVNNIEQVLVNSPAAGTWTVEVRGYNVPSGPQIYSLVGHGTADVGISFTFPNGLPAIMTPGTPETIDVEIVGAGQSIVSGSPTYYYRYDGGSFQSSTMTHVGGDLYRATLPSASCGDTPEYYFSADGTVSGVVNMPGGGATSPFTASVGQGMILFQDDFQTDTGWVATVQGASSGDWQRGVPVDDPDWDYDPSSDSDGSGRCYLTENAIGNTDVDDGSVTLTSPSIDMSAGNVTISYDYYLRLTDTAGGVDRLLVEINTNGGSGSWVEIARHDTDGGVSWRHSTITQADLDAAGVTPTANMKIRFNTNDADPQSINESGLDAFLVTSLECDAPDCIDDGDCDDSNPCTDDACVSSACEYTNNTAPCDDGLFCNGADTCAGGTCSQHAGDPCVGGGECADACNETADNCYDPAGTVCTDDGNVCTDNECDGSGTCIAVNNADPCDDGLFCNGADTCAGGTCSQHAGDPCVGGGECADACNETADNCYDPAGT
ncbi:MAG: S8 family serine peptidase, partial [Phycisphaerales bacterium]